jgi:uncharacterized protein YbaR (Trm112 family)
MSGFDPDVLQFLRCPESGGPLELVPLPAEVARAVVDRYREHFRDETPVAEQGLLCRRSGKVYPIVSDIPLLLQDESLPASVLEPAPGPPT